jgi:hypothetical protein
MKILPSVLELRCEPIPLVRIGLIGLGQRGMKTLERYAFIADAEFHAAQVFFAVMSANEFLFLKRRDNL